MKNHKNRIITICFLLIMTVIPAVLPAQIDDPGGDIDAPIDGGLGVLLAAGIGYGVKKLRDHRKQNSVKL